LSKMLLYIKNVGLTRLRVYTSWFMVLLALVFVYIVIQQFKTKFPFVRVAVITAVAMFAMLAFSQSDYWIARYNVEAYISGRNKELDSYMIMYELSDDASVYLLEQQGKIKDGADRYNEEIMQYKLNDYKRDKFSTYNIPSMLTRSELERTLNK
ncbi:MAG: DUF4173 domain-containing protein, partial [Oscillospiraceae bacterium]